MALHARNCSDKYVCFDPEYNHSAICFLDELIADMKYELTQDFKPCIPSFQLTEGQIGKAILPRISFLVKKNKLSSSDCHMCNNGGVSAKISW